MEKTVLIAKVTDDFLMAGSNNDMERFVNRVGKTFVVSRSKTDLSNKLNSTGINRASLGSIALSIKTYSRNIEPIAISKHRCMKQAKPATDTKMKA